MLLTGWKQIAQYLHCGVRTAQRWERNSLPVHRPVPGRRSQVVAESGDIDEWLRGDRIRRIADDELLAAITKTKKLREEIQQARKNLHLKMEALRKEIAIMRARRQQRHPT